MLKNFNILETLYGVPQGRMVQMKCNLNSNCTTLSYKIFHFKPKTLNNGSEIKKLSRILSICIKILLFESKVFIKQNSFTIFKNCHARVVWFCFKFFSLINVGVLKTL